jgi:hypothetical protein
MHCHLSRRNLLRATALAGPTIALASCSSLFTSVTTEGVTTVTVNLTKLSQYATALKNGVTTLFGVTAIVAALGPTVVSLVTGVVDNLADQAAALSAADNGATSLVFTTTNVPAALSAFQQDAVTVASNTATVFASLNGKVAADIETVISAFNTIVALAEAVLPTPAARLSAAAPATMTESQALKTLGVND